jgi:hypothetical protein
MIICRFHFFASSQLLVRANYLDRTSASASSRASSSASASTSTSTSTRTSASIKRSGQGRLTMAAKSNYLSTNCQTHLSTRETCQLNLSNLCQIFVKHLSNTCQSTDLFIKHVKQLSNTCQHMSTTCQTHVSTREICQLTLSNICHIFVKHLSSTCELDRSV